MPKGKRRTSAEAIEDFHREEAVLRHRLGALAKALGVSPGTGPFDVARGAGRSWRLVGGKEVVVLPGTTGRMSLKQALHWAEVHVRHAAASKEKLFAVCDEENESDMACLVVPAKGTPEVLWATGEADTASKDRGRWWADVGGRGRRLKIVGGARAARVLRAAFEAASPR